MNDSTGTALERTAPATLEQVRNTQVALDPAVVLTRAELNFFADMVVMADLIPFDRNTSKEVQKFRVMSKIVAGAAHRFDPISSQENLHVIQGRVVLSARGMAIKLRRTGRYDTRVEKLDETGCKLAVLEKDNTGKWILKGHVEFNREHADKAGLLKSNSAMYDKWGEDMFYANAIKRVCRRFAPEVLDTEPMDYRLSKESAAADAQAFQPAPAPVHQITAPAEPEQTGPEPPDDQTAEPNAIGGEYIDQEYQPEASEAIADAVEGEFIEAKAGETIEEEIDATPVEDKEESQLIDLREYVKEMFSTLTPQRQKDLIAGKPTIGKMDADQLAEMKELLEKETA
jgi:hypothetical protein